MTPARRSSRRVQTEPIAEGDDDTGFQCGEPALDTYFARHALANDRAGIGKTFVLRREPKAEDDPPILGFYALSMATVRAKQVSRLLRARLARYPMPVALIGRLAVHRAAQGRGLGQALLRDALRRILDLADAIGCLGVIVDAKNEAVERFY